MAAQTDTCTSRETDVRQKVREPDMFLVYIVNDDVTTFDFVVFVLVEVFGKTEDEGWMIAGQTHVQGKGLVGRYTKDIAMTKIGKATKLARANGFPLRLVAEPEEKR